MNDNPLQRLLQRATSLTRSGNLTAATAAIQSALRGLAPDRTPAAAPASPATAPPTSPATRRRGVIDVASRTVPDAVDVPARPPGKAPAFIAGEFKTTAGELAYKLFNPAGSAATPRPLIVMLHGCTQNPDDFAAGTGMNDAAEAAGCYVLYPAQSQRANAHRCWNWFKHNHQQRGRGEPALIAGMVHAVMAQHAIDPQRIFVAGLSAGGAMAAVLGETYPDLFAAVGVHSGLAPGVATDLSSALGAMKAGGTPRGSAASGVPTIVFHGDADRTVHPSNGAQVLEASAGPSGQAPIEHRHATAGGRASTVQRLYAADGSISAEYWVVEGAAHAWSGGSNRGSYTDPTGPDATAEMLRFFLAHPRRTAH